jgi:hypothetical protein
MTGSSGTWPAFFYLAFSCHFSSSAGRLANVENRAIDNQNPDPTQNVQQVKSVE